MAKIELDSSSAKLGCAGTREPGAVPGGKDGDKGCVCVCVYVQKTGKAGHCLNARGKNPIERG